VEGREEEQARVWEEDFLRVNRELREAEARFRRQEQEKEEEVGEGP
jgi:hypothetical protein